MYPPGDKRSKEQGEPERPSLTYASAGVDIDAGDEAVRLIKPAVESTHIPGVLGSLGGFAGLFEIPAGLKNPILVAGTDGVGTKLLLAQQMGVLRTVGIDLVAMSVNDVLTTGATPLFFLDYLALGKLVPAEVADIVAGVAEGCRQAGCALLGGEMAEMPGLYDPKEFDLAGFCVGVVERERIIDGSSVREGDVVLGLGSSGVHSNGFSLIRRVLAANQCSLTDLLPRMGGSIGQVLMEPTRIYVRSILDLAATGIDVHAMAHVTGGGLAGNLSRVIPAGLVADLTVAWTIPKVFQAIQLLGAIEEAEMFRTFNMGIGFVVVVPSDRGDYAARELRRAGEDVVVLGYIRRAASDDEPRVALRTDGGSL